MQLIETLRAQHQVVNELASRLARTLEGNEVAAANTALHELRIALLAHLEFEDRQLYAEMTRAALASVRGPDALLARTFAENMLRISGGLRDFLRRHSPVRDLAVLRRDWVGIAALLSQRNQSEEKVLYPLYLRLTAPAPATQPA